MNYLGIDLAWATPSAVRPNQSGVVALDGNGVITAAGWTVGVDETLEWIERHAVRDALVFIDAPLVVRNAGGQRLCEKQVGKGYWREKVAANSTNLSSPRQAGVKLLAALEAVGWRYDDGLDGPPASGRVVSECYPYTTIVGSDELGYSERPLYKRKPSRMKVAEFRPKRAAACDDLIRRVGLLRTADVPIDITSHPTTRRLVEEPSPLDDVAYKAREDLLDAALCAWTAAVWHRLGTDRCQVLGDAPDALRPAATIIAPAKPRQRTTC